MIDCYNIDVVKFCEDNLGIKLFPYQRMLLKQMDKHRSVFVRFQSRYLYYGSLLAFAEYMKQVVQDNEPVDKT